MGDSTYPNNDGAMIRLFTTQLLLISKSKWKSSMYEEAILPLLAGVAEICSLLVCMSFRIKKETELIGGGGVNTG
jgi:hypothetical protein